MGKIDSVVCVVCLCLCANLSIYLSLYALINYYYYACVWSTPLYR
jgi:hypothetical protein